MRVPRERGLDVDTIEDVVRFASDADPEATRAVRQAGRYLGMVPAANVDFFNPDPYVTPPTGAARSSARHCPAAR